MKFVSGQKGTIVIAVKKPNFVVLAADRLFFRGGTGGLEYSMGLCCKVVKHPDFPLAAAISGYSHLPIVGDSRPTVDHIADAFKLIKDKNELTKEKIQT